ncbi:unnamed protein product [marine sediment metagenome]|uniref:DUF3795 domain-containing protein n=1 Tax=marine sediment metagenome TaxID=412755 RepID=X1NCA5_9ZZZZ
MKIPPCGALCENCVAYKNPCKGCIQTNGIPYFSKKTCPVFECATKNKVEHCGLCDEFPCKKFLNKYDQKRGIITVLRRAGLLSLRKKIGNKAWIK